MNRGVRRWSNHGADLGCPTQTCEFGVEGKVYDCRVLIRQRLPGKRIS